MLKTDYAIGTKAKALEVEATFKKYRAAQTHFQLCRSRPLESVRGKKNHI